MSNPGYPDIRLRPNWNLFDPPPATPEEIAFAERLFGPGKPPEERSLSEQKRVDAYVAHLKEIGKREYEADLARGMNPEELKIKYNTNNPEEVWRVSGSWYERDQRLADAGLQPGLIPNTTAIEENLARYIEALPRNPVNPLETGAELRQDTRWVFEGYYYDPYQDQVVGVFSSLDESPIGLKSQVAVSVPQEVLPGQIPGDVYTVGENGLKLAPPQILERSGLLPHRSEINLTPSHPVGEINRPPLPSEVAAEPYKGERKRIHGANPFKDQEVLVPAKEAYRNAIQRYYARVAQDIGQYGGSVTGEVLDGIIEDDMDQFDRDLWSLQNNVINAALARGTKMLTNHAPSLLDPVTPQMAVDAGFKPNRASFEKTNQALKEKIKRYAAGAAGLSRDPKFMSNTMLSAQAEFMDTTFIYGDKEVDATNMSVYAVDGWYNDNVFEAYQKSATIYEDVFTGWIWRNSKGACHECSHFGGRMFRISDQFVSLHPHCNCYPEYIRNPNPVYSDMKELARRAGLPHKKRTRNVPGPKGIEDIKERKSKPKVEPPPGHQWVWVKQKAPWQASVESSDGTYLGDVFTDYISESLQKKAGSIGIMPPNIPKRGGWFDFDPKNGWLLPYVKPEKPKRQAKPGKKLGRPKEPEGPEMPLEPPKPSPETMPHLEGRQVWAQTVRNGELVDVYDQNHNLLAQLPYYMFPKGDETATGDIVVFDPGNRPGNESVSDVPEEAKADYERQMAEFTRLEGEYNQFYKNKELEKQRRKQEREAKRAVKAKSAEEKAKSGVTKGYSMAGIVKSDDRCRWVTVHHRNGSISKLCLKSRVLGAGFSTEEILSGGWSPNAYLQYVDFEKGFADIIFKDGSAARIPSNTLPVDAYEGGYLSVRADGRITSSDFQGPLGSLVTGRAGWEGPFNLGSDYIPPKVSNFEEVPGAGSTSSGSGEPDWLDQQEGDAKIKESPGSEHMTNAEWLLQSLGLKKSDVSKAAPPMARTNACVWRTVEGMRICISLGGETSMPQVPFSRPILDNVLAGVSDWLSTGSGTAVIEKFDQNTFLLDKDGQKTRMPLTYLPLGTAPGDRLVRQKDGTVKLVLKDKSERDLSSDLRDIFDNDIAQVSVTVARLDKNGAMLITSKGLVRVPARLLPKDIAVGSRLAINNGEIRSSSSKKKTKASSVLRYLLNHQDVSAVIKSDTDSNMEGHWRTIEGKRVFVRGPDTTKRFAPKPGPISNWYPGKKSEPGINWTSPSGINGVVLGIQPNGLADVYLENGMVISQNLPGAKEGDGASLLLDNTLALNPDVSAQLKSELTAAHKLETEFANKQVYLGEKSTPLPIGPGSVIVGTEIAPGKVNILRSTTGQSIGEIDSSLLPAGAKEGARLDVGHGGLYLAGQAPAYTAHISEITTHWAKMEEPDGRFWYQDLSELPAGVKAGMNVTFPATGPAYISKSGIIKAESSECIFRYNHDLDKVVCYHFDKATGKPRMDPGKARVASDSITYHPKPTLAGTVTRSEEGAYPNFHVVSLMALEPTDEHENPYPMPAGDFTASADVPSDVYVRSKPIKTFTSTKTGKQIFLRPLQQPGIATELGPIEYMDMYFNAQLMGMPYSGWKVMWATGPGKGLMAKVPSQIPGELTEDYLIFEARMYKKAWREMLRNKYWSQKLDEDTDLLGEVPEALKFGGMDLNQKDTLEILRFKALNEIAARETELGLRSKGIKDVSEYLKPAGSAKEAESKELADEIKQLDGVMRGLEAKLKGMSGKVEDLKNNPSIPPDKKARIVDEFGRIRRSSEELLDDERYLGAKYRNELGIGPLDEEEEAILDAWETIYDPDYKMLAKDMLTSQNNFVPGPTKFDVFDPFIAGARSLVSWIQSRPKDWTNPNAPGYGPTATLDIPGNPVPEGYTVLGDYIKDSNVFVAPGDKTEATSIQAKDLPKGAKEGDIVKRNSDGSYEMADEQVVSQAQNPENLKNWMDSHPDSFVFVYRTLDTPDGKMVDLEDGWGTRIGYYKASDLPKDLRDISDIDLLELKNGEIKPNLDYRTACVEGSANCRHGSLAVTDDDGKVISLIHR